ncbi:gamma-glutamyltranspeptidase family protein [Mycobacterium xenopi 3993]|nr:gamma-glutamyltranspeptidase family protein [Mycobacterium xenopi 3993]
MTAPFDWAFPYGWPRKPILARNVVCTSQPLAAQAGLQMLADGGSAVDAAVAAAITLTVVEPVSNGIGSDAFAIVWDGHRLHGLNASGRSLRRGRRSTSATRAFRCSAGTRSPCPARFRVGWSCILDSGGCPSPGSSSRQSHTPATVFWCRQRWRSSGRLRCRCSRISRVRRRVYAGGRAPRPGELVAFPDHAATLAKIAATNGAAFYCGELAAQLDAHAAANGAVLRASDLAAHRADWVGTISGSYRGYTIHEIPPNGQGIVALIALGILEQFEIDSAPADSADSLHLQIEALKLAFADAQAYVADIDHMPLRPRHLLDRNTSNSGQH